MHAAGENGYWRLTVTKTIVARVHSVWYLRTQTRWASKKIPFSQSPLSHSPWCLSSLAMLVGVDTTKNSSLLVPAMQTVTSLPSPAVARTVGNNTVQSLQPKGLDSRFRKHQNLKSKLITIYNTIYWGSIYCSEKFPEHLGTPSEHKGYVNTAKWITCGINMFFLSLADTFNVGCAAWTLDDTNSTEEAIQLAHETLIQQYFILLYLLSPHLCSCIHILQHSQWTGASQGYVQ